MTNKVKNVPELRFPEFSGEWEENILGDVVIIKSGWSPSNFEKKDASVLLIKVDDLNYSSRMINNSKLKVNENNKYKKIKKDSIIFPKRGAAILTNKVRMLGIDSYMDSNMMALEPKTINSEFLFTFIGKTGLYKIADTSTIPQINNKHIEPYKILLPSSTEQKYIGDFFSKLDRQIELEEQKLAKLEEQKKGYMQQIFSQELRFKDENGNDYPTWKKTTIKEVAKLTVGKSKKNENTGKYIIMDMGTVTKNGTMLTHKSTPHENDLLNKGDLVMPKDDIGGGHIIGKTVFIPESQKYVLGDHVYRLETKKCNGLFLHFYINSDIVNRSLKRKVTGSAQLGLNRKSVEEELVKVPCLEEQEKIGAFFSKLDTFIEKQLSKIELLKERKKGFLQKMFV